MLDQSTKNDELTLHVSHVLVIALQNVQSNEVVSIAANT